MQPEPHFLPIKWQLGWFIWKLTCIATLCSVGVNDGRTSLIASLIAFLNIFCIGPDGLYEWMPFILCWTYLCWWSGFGSPYTVRLTVIWSSHPVAATTSSSKYSLEKMENIHFDHRQLVPLVVPIAENETSWQDYKVFVTGLDTLCSEDKKLPCKHGYHREYTLCHSCD